MSVRSRWNIRTRTQMMSLGPALLLTLLLISFFTFIRIQDLRQELNHTGQLIANQLAPASEYGILSGNTEVLDTLIKTSTQHATCAICASAGFCQQDVVSCWATAYRHGPGITCRGIPGTGSHAGKQLR